MKVWTEVVYHWNDAAQDYVLAEDESSCFEYTGQTALCKASQEERDLAQKQAAFYSTMTAAYNTQFSKQSAILDAINAVWKPVLDAGVDQYGFTPEQDTALRTQATEGTAAEYKKAQQAVQQSMSARGGGNELLPSGVDEQIKSTIASSAAADQSAKNLNITNQGYERGYQNFLAATNALSGAGAQYNPLGYADANIKAGDSAFNSAQTIAMQDSAWTGMLGGMVGSIGAGFAQGYGGAACPVVGSSVVMANGSQKKVEDLVAGDYLLGLNGDTLVLSKPDVVFVPSCEVFTGGQTARVSLTHEFIAKNGGYVSPREGESVRVGDSSSTIEKVSSIGVQPVCVLKLSGDHTYCADGFWAQS